MHQRKDKDKGLSTFMMESDQILSMLNISRQLDRHLYAFAIELMLLDGMLASMASSVVETQPGILQEVASNLLGRPVKGSSNEEVYRELHLLLGTPYERRSAAHADNTSTQGLPKRCGYVGGLLTRKGL